MNAALLAEIRPISPGDIGVYATKGVIVFVGVVIAFRLLGKRHAGSFNVYDVATLMSAANAVQNSITGGHGNLGVGLSVSTAIVITAWTINKTIARHPRLQPLLGTPTIIVHDGKILNDHLRRQHITLADLDVAIRRYGLDDVAEVALAVLEANGSISVIARNTPTP